MAALPSAPADSHPLEGAGRRPARRKRRRAAGRILIVEDQPDIRQLVAASLEDEGHLVSQATTAEEGLAKLEAAHYDVVVTDYSLPGRTGAWMLHEAARRGRLEGTGALLVTAHPNPEPPERVAVVRKPIDFDSFLDQVDRLVATVRVGPAARVRARGSVRGAGRVRLVLYVSRDSVASLRAERTLREVLARFDPSCVELSVCDLSKTPLAADADRVVFTPTLVKRHPAPRTWIVGDLHDRDVVVDLLRVCGVEPADGPGT